LAIWVGGFTFYSAVVIPILHDEMDSLQAGGITKRVTDGINGVGLVALAVWWATAILERSLGTAGPRQARFVLLAASTAILVFLLVMHRVMNQQLDTGSLRGFYPLHRVYLIASTTHWFVNLGLMAVALILWSPRWPRGDSGLDGNRGQAGRDHQGLGEDVVAPSR